MTTVLFFPQKEQSFDVDKLISNINKKNLGIYKFDGQNGISDPYSVNFNEKASQNAFKEMFNFLKKH